MDQIPEVEYWKQLLQLKMWLFRGDLERSRRLPTLLHISAQTMLGDLSVLSTVDNPLDLTLFDMGSWINAETVTLDGGEFRMLAGEFNKLRKVSLLFFAFCFLL